MDDRRNPYIVLGVDFGATASEAAVAFARVSKRVKATGEALPFTVQDASWALHQIEYAELDPRATVDVYRVPADPSAYLVNGATDGPGSVPLRARSTDSSPESRRTALERAARVESEKALDVLVESVTDRALRDWAGATGRDLAVYVSSAPRRRSATLPKQPVRAIPASTIPTSTPTGDAAIERIARIVAVIVIVALVLAGVVALARISGSAESDEPNDAVAGRATPRRTTERVTPTTDWPVPTTSPRRTTTSTSTSKTTSSTATTVLQLPPGEDDLLRAAIAKTDISGYWVVDEEGPADIVFPCDSDRPVKGESSASRTLVLHEPGEAEIDPRLSSSNYGFSNGAAAAAEFSNYRSDAHACTNRTYDDNGSSVRVSVVEASDEHLIVMYEIHRDGGDLVEIEGVILHGQVIGFINLIESPDGSLELTFVQDCLDVVASGLDQLGLS